MSHFPHGHGTPENKITQFAHLGLMPSKFKGASFLPYMWNKSTDNTVELDATHKDRLSRSAQKKFRRWSRRLNGGNSTGTGWVLKDGQQTNQPSSLQDEYSVFYQAYQEIRHGRYDSDLSSSPSRYHHASNSPGADWSGPRRALHAGPTAMKHQRSKSQDFLSGFSPQSAELFCSSLERWYSRAERRFRLRKTHQLENRSDSYQGQSCSKTEMDRNSEVGSEGPLSMHKYRSEPTDHSSQLNTRRTRPSGDRTRSKSLGRFENDQRFSEGANELYHRRPTHAMGIPSSAESPDRRKVDLCQSSNLTDEESPSRKSRRERGKLSDWGTTEKHPADSSATGRKETPKKTCSGAVNFTLDAATFFGTNKERSRTPSSDVRYSKSECPAAEALHKTDEPIPNPISHPKRASISSRRESSQSIGEGRASTKDRDSSKIEETPRNVGNKISKKAAARERQERTPVSAERPTDTDQDDVIKLMHETKQKSDENHKMVRRSSPHKSDIKPKALIKPGLRSAKKEPRKSAEARGTPAKTETTTNGTKLVQRTLDSFFATKPSPSLQKSAPLSETGERLDGSKSRHAKESRSSKKRSKDQSRRSEKKGAKKRSPDTGASGVHVRRIYQDDEESRPVVRLTLLKEDQLWKVTSNSATEDQPSSETENTSAGRRGGSARLAAVSPIPSPAKRGRESPSADGIPPLKVTRRDSCDSVEKAKAELSVVKPMANSGDKSPTRRESCNSVVVLERSPSRKTDKVSKNKLSKRGSGDLKIQFAWNASSRIESCDSTLTSKNAESCALPRSRKEMRDSSKDLGSSRRESCDPSKGRSPRKESCVDPVESSRLSPPRLRSSPTKVTRSSPLKTGAVPLTKSPNKMTPTKKAVSPSKACPASPASSPAKASRRTPVKVQADVTQEDELAQVRRDDAARKAEADQAAQRNKKRHSRGRKVFAYCDVLVEHIERHPIQNEIPANKWHKWLNPSQLRCLTLMMLGNKDLCLKFTADGDRNEEWESAWVKLATRLNTICYSELTRLNTGLRMTVSEWKALWLEMKTTIRSRVEALKPEERRHSLGSLDCLLFSEDLYNSLMKSNGECLGKNCPRIWCPGACVGVKPPAEVPVRKSNEE
ncbi:hypothetical protein ONE63_003644 [Megalurothrips usitatus]|uniref:Serine/arginine repetitive matrix protein 2-like n=1 Tax=Megalurothrips usitatus TaxID=439358 RepID=A0AAV7X7V9_9NEOP|nr:hypothetical protein ONE63_003644 [Megalurothrips usitatus]